MTVLGTRGKTCFVFKCLCFMVMRTQATRPFGHAMLRVCVSTPRSEDGAAQQPRKPLPPPAPSASPRPGDRRPAAPHAAWSSPECRLDERGLWNGPVEMIRHLRERHREGRREEGGGTGEGGGRRDGGGCRREEGLEEGRRRAPSLSAMPWVSAKLSLCQQTVPLTAGWHPLMRK